ncbi:MAG: hypothetical protein HDT28_08575 [Clostridiales bacterium]|nr:hypothetical protein [Clostridiales bacterium]
MNYKAYRRFAVLSRIGITLVIAGGLCGLCAFSGTLGAILAAIAVCFGAISVIVSFSAEQTYTVYADRVVIKVRGKDYRNTVYIKDIVKTTYHRAFYEKSLLSGTITLTAKTDKGKIKKYKMRHITNAQQTIDYINNYNSNEESPNEA